MHKATTFEHGGKETIKYGPSVMLARSFLIEGHFGRVAGASKSMGFLSSIMDSKLFHAAYRVLRIP